MHSHHSRLSVFDIVYLFIILSLCWNVTGGSTIKGEMEVEYVPAESLRSIRLWTDGLINRRWLKQIGSTGCFNWKAQTKTCGDNTLTTSANADPRLAQSTGDLSVHICRHFIQNALTHLIWGFCWSNQSIHETRAALMTPGCALVPLLSLQPLFLTAWCQLVALPTVFYWKKPQHCGHTLM